MLPSFLILGAPRSGTTHLYRGLRQHPDVFMSDFKEPMFFAYENNPAPSVISDRAAYEALFANANPDHARGEASTLYLYSDKSPQNIHRTVPEARLVAILRNPTERAFSQYTFQRFLETEPLATFEAALAAEPERAKTDRVPFHLYRPVGLYSEQIHRYYELFPKEQLLILLQEDLETQPDRVFRDIFRHIGVDDAFVPDLRHKTNASGVPQNQTLFRAVKSAGRVVKRFLPETLVTRLSGTAHETMLARPTMTPETRAMLIDYFRDDITRTAALIDRDLSAWLH